MNAIKFNVYDFFFFLTDSEKENIFFENHSIIFKFIRRKALLSVDVLKKTKNAFINFSIK